MLPGPVFSHEMLTTSRRKRYYFLRFIYGFALLSLIAVNYRTFAGELDLAVNQVYNVYTPNGFRQLNRGLSLEQTQQIMGMFANRTVVSFLNLQDAVIILLTPALVAGVIATEKQRKTLHYLLASRLTNSEIILGKLFARLSHVGLFLAVGLPIFSLVILFGGVDPNYVIFSYLNSCSTAFFLASLALFVSCIARKAREAIFIAYVFQMFWLLFPLVNAEVAAEIYPDFLRWMPKANEYLLYANPLAIHLREFRSFGPPGAVDREFAFRSFVLFLSQTLLGLGFVRLSIRRLRPTFAREGGGGRPTFWSLPRSLRIFARPPCGEDAILWKERYATPPGKLGRLLGIPITVVTGLLLSYILLEFAVVAFSEMSRYGFYPTPTMSGETLVGDDRRGYDAREQLILTIRSATIALSVLWMLSIAGSAAGSITSEQEEDTWISLVSTILTGPQIIRAKIFGAIWRNRVPAFFMIGFWLVGMALGALHPLGFLAGLIELIVFGWFVAAVGTFFSLRAKNTTRALAWTFVVLFFVSGGYLLLTIPLGFPDTSPYAAILAIPFLWNWSLVSFDNVSLVNPEVAEILIYNNRQYYVKISIFDSNRQLFAGNHSFEVVSVCVIGVLLFAAAALVLTLGCVRRFDVLVDRPNRFNSDRVDRKRVKIQ